MISFFVGCFVFGLLFSVATFLLGAFGETHFHFALPGFLSGAIGSHAHAHAPSNGSNGVSPFNLSSLSAFLTWFGGAGYLLMRYSPLTAITATVAALACGAAGSALVFTAIARYIVPRLTVMNPEDFRVQGVLARVSTAIRPDGIGEVVYALGGTRHSDGARSESGRAIERGTQVVILRIEKGIAYVEPWATFADTHRLPVEESGAIERFSR